MSGGKLKKTNKNQQINRGRNHPVNTFDIDGKQSPRRSNKNLSAPNSTKKPGKMCT